MTQCFRFKYVYYHFPAFRLNLWKCRKGKMKRKENIGNKKSSVVEEEPFEAVTTKARLQTRKKEMMLRRCLTTEQRMMDKLVERKLKMVTKRCYEENLGSRRNA